MLSGFTKKTILSGLLSLGVACLAFACFIRPARAENVYGLWVGGVQVTDSNCGNITGGQIISGTITYDSLTSTLTLNNALVYGFTDHYKNAAIYADSSIPHLTIDLVGNNRLASAGFDGQPYSLPDTIMEAAAIYVNGSLTIRGDGGLEARTQNTTGNTTYVISAQRGTVYIEGGNLALHAGFGTKAHSYGIYASGIDISGGNVEASGRSYIRGIGIYGSVIISGGSVATQGTSFAIGREPSLRNMEAIASYEYHGNNPTSYKSSELESYKWFETKPKAPAAPRVVVQTVIPETGDHTPLMLMFGLLLFSGCALAIRMFSRRHARKEQ